MGYPIVNDMLYGKESDGFAYMGLWADQITYKNPITHKKHTIHDFSNSMFEPFL